MAFNDDEKPDAPIAGSKDGLVTMAIPDYNPAEVGMTNASLTAMVVITGASSSAIREGLDLVAVLDVSGSMAGAKFDSMKKAMKFVIMKLTDLDRLSIVTFSSTAARLNRLGRMTTAAKNDLNSKVDALVANGGTNIKAGLEMGLAVLRDRVHTESRTPNILLMSDGRPEPKEADGRDVNPGEVPVYTVGFGSGTEYKLMSDLATKSLGGTYSAVPDGNNLIGSFSMVLGALVTVVATDVQLTLKPKTADRDLDKMTVAPGTAYPTTTDDTGIITIKFGTLSSTESRNVNINFTLKDRTDQTGFFNATLAVARHSYAAQETPQPAQNIVIPRTLNPSTTADDPSSAGAAAQRRVKAEVVRRQHAENITDASAMAEAGKLDDARDKIMDAQNAVEDIMLDDGDKMVTALRGELLQLQTFMESQALYDKRGHPYALATITSHGRQRIAGRGDEGEVASLYITPRMITYLEQAKRFEANPKEPVPTADDDVKEEIKNNPLGTIAAPLALYLDTAIQALQSIQKVLADSTQPKR